MHKVGNLSSGLPTEHSCLVRSLFTALPLCPAISLSLFILSPTNCHGNSFLLHCVNSLQIAERHSVYLVGCQDVCHMVNPLSQESTSTLIKFPFCELIFHLPYPVISHSSSFNDIPHPSSTYWPGSSVPLRFVYCISSPG